MKRLRWLLLPLAAYLATGVAQVRPEERAVVRRFGAVVAQPGPGLWVGLPWGIDRIDRVPVRTVRQLAVGFDADTDAGRLLTGDQNLVDVKLVVEYAVDETDLVSFVLNRDRVDALLAQEAEALAAEWLAGQAVDDALLTGRAALSSHLLAQLPERLRPQRLGVLLQRISVDHLAAPAEVRDAFDAVNQAQTAIRTKENQARQEAASRLRDAEILRFKLAQQAAAYREEKVRPARAEADAFTLRLVQYRKLREANPDVLAAIWWDELGRTLAGMKGRGRIDLLDAYLGKDGLDVTQFLAPRKR